ncbi:MAG TPA: hypothetical protein PLO50_11330 [Nitrospira sp.]|nr:hypothetical protein [Nitrospira sp.]
MSKESSFLTYGGSRWLWVSLISAVVCLLHYAYYQSRTVAYGGSAEGLLYGVIGTVLIGVLMYLGIRRRSYTSQLGSLQGWVSAHVYLGLLTVIVIPLHAGFRFGWDVHTLAFVLLIIVVGSGVIGISLYRVIPTRLTRLEMKQQADSIDPELDSLFKAMRTLVMAKSEMLVRLYQQELAATQRRTSSGWRLLWKGQTGDLLAEQSAFLAKKASLVPPEDRAAFQDLSQLLLKKTQLEIALQQQMGLRNALKAWLYIHVPVSIAMVCSLVVHVVVVFLY